MRQTPIPTVFKNLLANGLLGGFTGTFVWFSITFWAYLETKSVIVTSVVTGAFGIASALFGVLFGTYVDSHRKHRAMVLSALITLIALAGAAVVYTMLDTDGVHLGNPILWALIVLVMVATVAGNLRALALATCVSLLVPEDARDRANGLVGTVTGISFTFTSVLSGLVVGRLGMGWAIVIAIAATALSLAHLFTIRFDEDLAPVASAEPTSRFDLSGALDAIRAVPGLRALILFAAFNNFIGGVYMSLLDAYGLELVSVETWGLLWGFLSCGFIIGGLIVAKRGLGTRPMRVLIVGNFLSWTVASVFALGASLVLVAAGLLFWLITMPIIEAAEQTVLQRTVPFAMQGRVFGFAQMIENAASPIVALSIGPFAEKVTIPFMTTGRGADIFGRLFGSGIVAGLGLCFCAAGIIGVIVSLLARASRPYRLLDRVSATVPSI